MCLNEVILLSLSLTATFCWKLLGVCTIVHDTILQHVISRKCLVRIAYILFLNLAVYL